MLDAKQVKKFGKGARYFARDRDREFFVAASTLRVLMLRAGPEHQDFWEKRGDHLISISLEELSYVENQLREEGHPRFV